mgnify:FL=1
MHLATAGPVTPTAPPPDPVLQQRIDALMDSTRQQIAEILSGGQPAGPRPATMSLEDACAILARPLRTTPGAMVSLWRRGKYPIPDLWSGSGRRMKRKIVIPAAWVDWALRDGPSAFTRPVKAHELLRYLSVWPDPMSVKVCAHALGIGETTAKRLEREGVLPTRTPPEGLKVSHTALADYLARCISEAVTEWAPPGVL